MIARRLLVAVAFRAAYLGACALVWAGTRPWLAQDEPGTVFVLLMNVVTFPAGLLAAPLLAVVDWLMDRAPVPNAMPVWFVHFAGYVVAGYAQWFWWVPSALRGRPPQLRTERSGSRT